MARGRGRMVVLMVVLFLVMHGTFARPYALLFDLTCQDSAPLCRRMIISQGGKTDLRLTNIGDVFSMPLSLMFFWYCYDSERDSGDSKCKIAYSFDLELERSDEGIVLSRNEIVGSHTTRCLYHAEGKCVSANETNAVLVLKTKYLSRRPALIPFGETRCANFHKPCPAANKTQSAVLSPKHCERSGDYWYSQRSERGATFRFEAIDASPKGAMVSKALVIIGYTLFPFGLALAYHLRRKGRKDHSDLVLDMSNAVRTVCLTLATGVGYLMQPFVKECLQFDFVVIVLAIHLALTALVGLFAPIFAYRNGKTDDEGLQYIRKFLWFCFAQSFSSLWSRFIFDYDNFYPIMTITVLGVLQVYFIYMTLGLVYTVVVAACGCLRIVKNGRRKTFVFYMCVCVCIAVWSMYNKAMAAVLAYSLKKNGVKSTSTPALVTIDMMISGLIYAKIGVDGFLSWRKGNSETEKEERDVFLHSGASGDNYDDDSLELPEK